MAIYKMQAPDGATYQVEGPDGATDDDVRNEIIRQNPQLSAPQPTSPSASGKRMLTIKDIQPTPEQIREGTNKLGQVINPVGLGEAAIQAGTGTLASAAGGLAGIVGSILPGPEGQGAAWSQKVQHAGTYDPRTESGKSVGGAINNLMTAGQQAVSDTSAYLGGKVGAENAGRLVGDVGPSIVASIFGLKGPLTSIATTPYKSVSLPSLPDVAYSAGKTLSNLPTKSDIPQTMTKLNNENLAAKAATASAADWQNAPRIDAAKDARSLPHPIALNPATSNPTMRTKGEAIAADTNRLNTMLSKKNANAWGNNAKVDMGIDTNTPLTSPEPFNKAREKYSPPYEEVKKMGPLEVPDEFVNKLQQITPPDLAVNQGAGPRVQSVIDNVMAKVEAGKLTGAQVLDEVRGLRASAKSLYDKDGLTKPSPVDSAVADSHMAIANALEDLLENNVAITNPSILPQLKESRKKMATTYLYENATDFNTGLLDPNKLARQTSNNPSITGVAQKMGRVAGNYPEVADISSSIHEPKINKYTRAGIGGAGGLAAASVLGTPIAPAMAIGAGITTVGGMLTRKKILSDAYQSKYAVPLDRRIPIEVPQLGMLTGEKP